MKAKCSLILVIALVFFSAASAFAQMQGERPWGNDGCEHLQPGGCSDIAHQEQKKLQELQGGPFICPYESSNSSNLGISRRTVTDRDGAVFLELYSPKEHDQVTTRTRIK